MSRTCARCGIDIEFRDKRSRHCSTLCRDRDCEGSAKGVSRACLWCGKTFIASKAPHVYCARECRSLADVDRNREAYNRRNAARRARERNAGTDETFTRTEIFDRDGWICQLCLSPIDWNLSGRGRFAPALDHILPLNQGGKHQRSNVWAAHSGCNASKQDRLDIVILPVPERR